MAIRISRIALTKEQLVAIPEAERNLIVLLGHAANEINILVKMIHFASSSKSENPLQMQAEQSQVTLLGALLAGKVYEFWVLLQRGYFGAAVSREYSALLDKGTSEALAAMSRYFSQESLVSHVRHSHAFHYDPAQVTEGFRATNDGQQLDFYLSDSSANSFYAFADTIVHRGLLERIVPGDPGKAVTVLVEETLRAAGWAEEMMGGLTMACLKRHVAKDKAFTEETIAVEDAPESSSVRIPYFVVLT